jgi:hypothetical protein
MILTEYDPATGRITALNSYSGIDEDSIEASKRPDRDYIEAESYIYTQYVLDGAVVDRPASPVTLSDLTLQGVPTGSTLTINGDSYEAEGDVELEFPLPGTYSLRVECWPYKDWAGEVVV